MFLVAEERVLRGLIGSDHAILDLGVGAEQGGNLDEALGFAQVAKEKMPDNAAVVDTLGWLYYLKGRYLSAISELLDSLKLDPLNPIIHYHLGLAYFKNDQPGEAKEFFEKALKINPNFNGAEEARDILKEIKK